MSSQLPQMSDKIVESLAQTVAQYLCVPPHMLKVRREYHAITDLIYYTLWIDGFPPQHSFTLTSSVETIAQVHRELEFNAKILLDAVRQGHGGNNVSGQSNQAGAGHTAQQQAAGGVTSGGPPTCYGCGQSVQNSGHAYFHGAGQRLCKSCYYAYAYGYGQPIQGPAAGLPQGTNQHLKTAQQYQAQTAAFNQQQAYQSQQAYNNQLGNAVQAQQALQAQQHRVQLNYGLALLRSMTGIEERFPNLETTETKLGELIGYRGWRLKEGKLLSFSALVVWEPKTVMHGDTKSVKEHCGVYSFKTMKDLENTSVYFDADVIGTVALWGDVIEHEHGYRSEYAKVNSIIKVNNKQSRYWVKPPFAADKLRRTYGLS